MRTQPQLPKPDKNPSTGRLDPKTAMLCPNQPTQNTIMNRIWLPYTRPPLTANQRLHWAERARLTRQVRRDTRLLAYTAHIPKNCKHVRIELHYIPRDNRRRDADNIVTTLKACCDGLVDYGLVPDDTPNLMTKVMPTIHPAQKTPPGPNNTRLYLTITTN